MLCLLLLGFAGWLWIAPKLDPWARYSGTEVVACKMNQRNVQQMVRALENMEGRKPGDPIDWDKIFDPKSEYYLKKPVCSVHGEYEYSPVITPRGEPVIRCSDSKHRMEDPG